MKSLIRIVAGASVGALALLGVSAGAAGATGIGEAHHGFPDFDRHAVFAQTNDPIHNRVLAYLRRPDGTLTAAGSFATGGTGGKADGAVVDPIASQGSVAFDAAAHELVVTNAGSSSVSVFRVDGASLQLRQVLPSGGAFPVSATIHDGLVYVLNAGGDGSVTGYRAGFGGLHTIGTTSLGLGNTNPPFFTAGPGQVGFSPDGRELLVTTKSHGTVVGFPVRYDGRLGAAVANPSTGAVPFAFSFDSLGRLVVVEAGTNSVSTHVVRANGSLINLAGPVTDGQQAACWITVAGRYAYVANAGSSTISTFRLGFDGSATLLPGVTPTSGGSVDLVSSPDGRFVYSENGAAGTIDEFRTGPDGSLTAIGRVTGLAAQVFEGITAT